MKFTLKAARHYAGKTQTQLAAELGVSKQTIHEWENGIRAVKTIYLPAIARATGVPVDCIILPLIITKGNKN